VRQYSAGGGDGVLPPNCACTVSTCSSACLLDSNTVSQTIALTLNVGYSPDLANFILTSGQCKGKSVQEVLDGSNCVVSGSQNCGFTESDVKSCGALINENFDEGDIDEGNLCCPGDPGCP